MTEKTYPSNTRKADVERSTEDIRQDIAEEKENISQTVEEISERIQEKMDWREYVKGSPYLALGAAAGLGYLASRIFIKHPTPMQRIMRPIAEEVRHSLGGLLAGAAGSSLIKVTLISIATKAAANWILDAASTGAARGCTEPQTKAGRDSTVNSEVDT